MIQDLIAFFQHELATNDFFSAALVAAPVSFALFTLRGIPNALLNHLRRFTTQEIRFNSDMADYSLVQRFVADEMVFKNLTRRYLFEVETQYSEEKGRDETFRGLTAGYGRHYGRYKGRYLKINRETAEGQQTEKFKETLIITFLSRSKKFVEEVAQDILMLCEKNIDKDTISLKISSGDYWQSAARLPKRAMNTIFTADNEGPRIVGAIRKFEDSKQSFRDRGLPYHLGILLTGEPGTGKTSLIHAVASELNRDISYLSLGGINTDAELSSLISGRRHWNQSILVIEDTDAATDAAKVRKEDDEKDSKEKLTLSALLNVLDGLLSPDGLVVIATTNHPDRLDPALIRPGRFDIRYDMGRLGPDEMVRMAKLFGVQASRHKYVPLTGAELRKTFINITGN